MSLKEGDLLIIIPGKMHLAEATDPSAMVIGLTYAPRLVAGQEDSLCMMMIAGLAMSAGVSVSG